MLLAVFLFIDYCSTSIVKGAAHDIGPPMTYAQMKIRALERSAKMAAPGEISAFSFCQHFAEK